MRPSEALCEPHSKPSSTFSIEVIDIVVVEKKWTGFVLYTNAERKSGHSGQSTSLADFVVPQRDSAVALYFSSSWMIDGARPLS